MYIYNQGVLCDEPETPDNAMIVTNSSHYHFAGITIQYECNPGYLINSTTEDSQTCSDEGIWTGKRPCCVGKPV